MRADNHSAAAGSTPGFADFGLPEPLLRALTEVGYESPSPIQAATIPQLLAGRDMIGQAQTGTGKTAAFALPILARIAGDGLDPSQRNPQALVLAPTRELAIQVAEAFQKYAHHLPGFQVLPIYGGQSYYPQLQALKRGVQVVVGTPGRIIDHLSRGSLDLSGLRCLVLDEADEMLRMGFIEDVETVLKQTPASRQVVLFSATMPAQIRRIAQTYLKDPVEVAIETKTATAANTRQRYWMVSGVHKLDALTRILEAEPFEAMIVFVRTKIGTEELAGKLAARGIAAAAINGDIQQALREKTIQSLRDGRIDVLVATDVAARGLDVERVSHVLNYDIPADTGSYVHRIGRTGRAGREGEAILFVTPRERGMLRSIERATRQPIEAMALPSIESVNQQRVSKFLGRIGEALEGDQLGLYRDLIERYEREHNVPAVEIAAALASLAQGEHPLLLSAPEKAPSQVMPHGRSRDPSPRASPQPALGADKPFAPDPASPRPQQGQRAPTAPETAMETFRIEVGHAHGVKPGNIVGAIANEAELDSRYIGRIDICDDFSLVDLPEGMPRELMEYLRKVRVAGRPLLISRSDEKAEGSPRKTQLPAHRPKAAASKPHADRPRKPSKPRSPR